MADYFKKRPMLISAVCCTVSAICGFYCIWGLLVCFGAALMLFATALERKSGVYAVVWLSVCLMCLNCFYSLEQAQSLSGMKGRTVETVICFEKTVNKSESSYKSYFEVVREGTLPNKTRIALWHEPFNFTEGDVLNVEITLREVGAKMRAVSYSDGVYLFGDMEKLAKAEYGERVLSTADKIRNYISKRLFSNMTSESAATMSALVFGDRSYLSDQFYENVKSAGVAHVMVVSGMHLSILVSLMLVFVERCAYNKYLKVFIMLFTVLALCTVCGFTSSVLRASVTYVILATALLAERSYSGANALGGTLTFSLITSPFIIFNVAFALSVLSTFGILAVALPICKAIRLKGRVLKYALETVVVSLSAMVLTLPIAIYVFGYISNAAIITNLLIALPVTAVLSVTVAALAVGLVLPFASGIILRLLDYGVMYINSVINYFGTQKFAVTRLPWWSGFVAAAIISAVFTFLLTCKKRRYVLKLEEMNQRITSEGGNKLKWQ